MGLFRFLFPRPRIAPPQDGYRDAWASQLEAERQRNDALVQKNRGLRKELRIRQLRMGLAGFMGAGITVLALATVVLGDRFFSPQPHTIQIDEIHIYGVVPVEIVELGPEVCDGLDNDGDGIADEEVCVCTPASTRACLSGLPGVCAAGVQMCDADGRGWSACLSTSPPSSETCDGIDNDCDGVADEEVCGMAPVECPECSP